MKSNFYLLFSIFLLLGSVPTFAQIGIGTKTPAPSAALEVTSSTNNKGILIPRITATQKDAIVSPAEGLLVYQTTAPTGFYYYSGTAWKLMAIQTDIAGKVDKIDGKDLSTNDYTTAEKTKLAAITGTNTGDQTTITGNAGTATKLATARNINGVAFDGSADITIAAAASAEQLTGTTLKSTVTGSSLTSVGTLGNLTVTNPIAGSVTGNAATATTATTAGNITATSNSTLTSLSNLATVGTINSGVWSGTAVAVEKGGTGATTASAARTNLGLANVDNTSDLNKQISTATQAALDGKLSKIDTTAMLSSYRTGLYNKLNFTDTAAMLYNYKTRLNLKLNVVDTTAMLYSYLKKNGTWSGTTIAIAKGGTGATTKSAGFDALSPMTTSGDIIYGGTSGTGTRLGKGSDGQVLTLASGVPSWANASGGGSGVPYTGATGAVNLGGYDLTVNELTIGSGKVGTSGSNSNTIVGGSGSSRAFNSNSVSSSTAIGFNTLSASTPGDNNTTVGAWSLVSNTGTKNSAMGVAALERNLGGSDNTAIGYYALRNNLTGSNNTALGHNSLISNSPGEKNTMIGASADLGADNLTNATAIGYQAKVAASNTIQLGADGTNGTTAITNVKTSGTITAGAVTYPKVDGAANQVLSTNGSGTLAWITPTGLPSSGNTAGDMLYWNGTAWVKVPAGSNGQSLFFQNGTPTWNGTFSYRNTVKTATGKVWMDRNLGASQVATSATDALAYGDLYQWGRGSDGHESRSAGETNIVSTSDTPGNGNFINQSSNRWRDPTNLNLWQGINGINNPCPSGFRLPTKTEWEAEIATWTGSGFDSPLKLPLGGHQHPTLATPWQVGGSGSYWTSTPYDGLHSWNLGLGSTSKTMGIAQQGHGFSVRCIKD